MIGEKFLASLIGIDPDWDTDEHQASWEHQKYLDENDLDDFDFDSDAIDDNEESDRAGDGPC